MPLDFSEISELTNNTSTEDTKVRFSPLGRPLEATEPDTPASDWEIVSRRQQERIEELERLLVQRRVNPENLPPNTAKPSMTADKLRREWGDLKFLHQSTQEERVRGLGVDPAKVDYGLIEEVFETGDSRTARELMTANPFKYRQLREVYLVTLAMKTKKK